ncbi:sporulation protein [Brevibacillus invocatus]|uniref:sporulation protein n=1 Tax=Brevibacillus invocatus TaxID=173959 RepID=UPI00203F7F38|nr:sporulation protein [Brevibacillus invocatus]MCM3079331.1 sporulation protein [Brevibacillus invocatus]MCM3429428.1 sporulation protein [Brevibacillus invocatus]
MFKKIMAKMGIGAARIDLRLDRPGYRMGETATGVIRIEGGNVEQRIIDLRVNLLMKVSVRGQDVIKQVESFPVKSQFTVQPKPTVQEIPFSFALPDGLAISTPSVQYNLQTKLDVEMAVDPTDMDLITILPPEPVDRVLQALERNHFRQKPQSGRLTPYGQEFSFFPGADLGVPLKELEVIFFVTPEELRLLIELDLANGFMGREKEYKAEIVVPQELLAAGQEEALSRFLLDKIRAYANNPQSIPYVSMAGYQQRAAGFAQHGQRRSGMGGMIGGMAAGLLGGMLLSEMMSGMGDEMAGGEMGEEEPAMDEEMDMGFDDFDEF